MTFIYAYSRWFCALNGRAASKTAISTMSYRLRESSTFANMIRRSVQSPSTRQQIQHRTFAESKTSATKVGETAGDESKKGIWNNVQFWATAGAIAGWGMSGAAIYDASRSGPEIISLNMTGVLILYSSLFARWAWIVQPRNSLLAACHATNVVAQSNQIKRALEYKMENGQEGQVHELVKNAGIAVATGAGCIVFGPTVQRAVVNAKIGPVSDFAASPAGPFTVHFWAPMSKWLISGASFVDFDRPTDKVSLPQYTALTLTGFFFSRYALLVTPINYMLCSVNIALFGSSFYHLARKIKADYM